MPGASPNHVALMAALRALPAGQREAIALHYLANLPVSEVAEILQVSEGTVKACRRPTRPGGDIRSRSPTSAA